LKSGGITGCLTLPGVRSGYQLVGTPSMGDDSTARRLDSRTERGLLLLRGGKVISTLKSKEGCPGLYPVFLEDRT